MNAYTPTTSLRDLATPLEIQTCISQGIDTARQASQADYIGATDALIDLCIQRGACFSSGEISAWIRTYRPDVRFNPMGDIGSRVRSRHSEGLPDYTSGPVLQVSRYTRGYSSTAFNHLVYVYAPSPQAGQTHPFEVIAPDAGGAVPDADSLPPVPVQLATPLQAPPTRRTAATRTATPARKPRTKAKAKRRSRKAKAIRALPPNIASVHGNRRLCVPRGVFESLATLRGASLPGGSKVYVARTGDVVSVTLDPAPDAAAYTLVSTRQRLLFASRGGAALVPGAHYAVSISNDGLTIDLSTPA